MPRGKKLSSTDKLTSLQTKIDLHKSQIENLEKQKSTLQKELHTEAINDLALFIEKKKLSINDAKKIISQSFAVKPTVKPSNKQSANVKSSTHNEEVRNNV